MACREATLHGSLRFYKQKVMGAITCEKQLFQKYEISSKEAPSVSSTDRDFREPLMSGRTFVSTFRSPEFGSRKPETFTKRDPTRKMMYEVSNSDIFVGDLIRLKYDDICPCDLLILATSEDHHGRYICRVDTLFDDGKSARQRKEAVTLTKSFAHWAEDERAIKYFLNRLNAKLNYKTNKKTKEISGSFKIKDDPKLENFDENKIIKRGTLLKSKWVIGLVLYNGKLGRRTTIWEYMDLKPRLNKIERQIRNFTLISSVLCLVATILCNLLYIRLRLADDDVGQV